jgi:hypothetical protein
MFIRYTSEVIKRVCRSEENLQEHTVNPGKSDVSVDRLRILGVVPSHVFEYTEAGVCSQRPISVKL